MCDVELAPGTTIARTEKVLKEFLESIRDIPSIETIMLDAGSSMMSGSGENYGSGFIQLKDWSQRQGPGESQEEIMRRIEAIELEPGYHVEWTGIAREQRENEGRLGPLLALACLFAYLFLVAQYESWTLPASVMLSIIFAIAGGYAALAETLETADALALADRLGKNAIWSHQADLRQMESWIGKANQTQSFGRRRISFRRAATLRRAGNPLFCLIGNRQ